MSLSATIRERQEGGLYSFAAASSPKNVTLKDNASPLGGGASVELGTTTLTNTLFADGVLGVNCDGVRAGDSNLSDDNTCSFGESRDGVNLWLGPLTDNGGLTKTHLPPPLSPAIDFGRFVITMLTDQRSVIVLRALN